MQPKTAKANPTRDLFHDHLRDVICPVCEPHYLAQRTQLHRTIARWQRDYFAMKVERDALAQLLKMHHDARAAAAGLSLMRGVQ